MSRKYLMSLMLVLVLQVDRKYGNTIIAFTYNCFLPLEKELHSYKL